MISKFNYLQALTYVWDRLVPSQLLTELKGATDDGKELGSLKNRPFSIY